ncbi:methyl-accepting chemotaxis protein [Sagittula marina]|uniref:Methyl-accepting chemotaxis protein n=1 Tax=Sagittula marina TaxID=943940 RepID=A0A7W6DT66_9RHOB|nr:PAS domain-containing methyl-accepting chemotaxis protein [Sagittula marina]MBB3985603.1 methyl-accepting chemotaxis protein [Sagittula marina]
MAFFRKTPPVEGIGRRYEKPDLLDVVDATQAVIHFKPDGEVLFANENFLSALGYSANEVEGEHHRMFVDEDYAKSEEYAEFWQKLEAGEPFTSQYKRIRKDGEPIYILATYCPVRDQNGIVRRVIKIASDVTDRQNTINEIEKGLNALSSGDLSMRVTRSSVPELVVLGEAFNDTMENLSALVENVKKVSDTVYTASQGIQSTTIGLSQRTETTAATLEETAAAIEELSSTANSAAEEAKSVKTTADATSQTAETGRELVANLTEAMEKIESSSDQIGEIISVIEGIAFQTNLLALNAGVEAARAGDSGRGFAVVASEVRGLAQRSSESASEIKSLIQSSSQNVKDGSTLVGRAAKEFESVFTGVNTISRSVQHIASNLQMQSDVLKEINVAVSQLDQATQQNAATVNEVNDSGMLLAREAETLVGEISHFSVTGSVSGAEAPAFPVGEYSKAG